MTSPLLESRYELWASDIGNIIGTYTTLNELVEAAYELGRANPDEEAFLSAVDARQIAERLRETERD